MVKDVGSKSLGQGVKDDGKLKKKIKESFVNATQNRNIRLPQNIWLEEIEDGIKMSLSLAAIGKDQDKLLNMQDNAAAFEGWAAAIYAHYLAPINSKDSVKRKIILGLQEKIEDVQNIDEKQGHYNRFLYRAMKFTEEYSEWIKLDSSLQDTVDYFKKWFEKEDLINNEPSKNRTSNPSESSGNPSTESKVELFFTNQTSVNIRKKLLDNANMQTEKLYRQLPVGLFKGKDNRSVIRSNSFFTGGKSAIDLWAIDDEYIALFELKTNNKMIGIITELFFYSEYVNDVFIRRNNIHCAKSEDKDSDYYNLTTDETAKKKIKAFFLTNELHPLITKEVIELLNVNNNDVIKYADIKYDLCESLKVLL